MKYEAYKFECICGEKYEIPCRFVTNGKTTCSKCGRELIIQWDEGRKAIAGGRA